MKGGVRNGGESIGEGRRSGAGHGGGCGHFGELGAEAGGILPLGGKRTTQFL